MRFKKSSEYNSKAQLVLFRGDCLDLLESLPDESVQLILTSPPYNLGKNYEKKLKLEEYVCWQHEVITSYARVLKPQGSICYQTGNMVEDGQIFPIDSLLFHRFHRLGFKLRNRIVWVFGHGLHCKNRFSGRYETINWFTKSDDYTFNLDPLRIPQRYPGKRHYKGPRKGQYSCNPLGKNPGDVWSFPNVKHGHLEKTCHDNQFPLELAEKLILALTDAGDWVLDPFCGVSTSLIAALKNGRRAVGAEKVEEYIIISKHRILLLERGELKVRPWGEPKYNKDRADEKNPLC